MAMHRTFNARDGGSIPPGPILGVVAEGTGSRLLSGSTLVRIQPAPFKSRRHRGREVMRRFCKPVHAGSSPADGFAGAAWKDTLRRGSHETYPGGSGAVVSQK